MKEDMKQIIRQQQEYEYLKQSASFNCLSDSVFTNAFTKQKILPCLTSCAKKRKVNACFHHLVTFSFVLFIILFAISYLVMLVCLICL